MMKETRLDDDSMGDDASWKRSGTQDKDPAPTEEMSDHCTVPFEMEVDVPPERPKSTLHLDSTSCWQMLVVVLLFVMVALLSGVLIELRSDGGEARTTSSLQLNKEASYTKYGPKEATSWATPDPTNRYLFICDDFSPESMCNGGCVGGTYYCDGAYRFSYGRFGGECTCKLQMNDDVVTFDCGTLGPLDYPLSQCLINVPNYDAGGNPELTIYMEKGEATGHLNHPCCEDARFPRGLRH